MCILLVFVTHSLPLFPSVIPDCLLQDSFHLARYGQTTLRPPVFISSCAYQLCPMYDSLAVTNVSGYLPLKLMEFQEC